jgi:predicted MPP superfamily phosphohydrolase
MGRHITAVSSNSTEPGPRRRRRGRFILIALTIAIGVQIPMVDALIQLTGRAAPLLVLAALLTGGFLSMLLSSRAVLGAPGRLRLYGILWPFFIWWTVALLFALLSPLAFVVRHLFPVSLEASRNAALIVAAVGAALALTPRHRVRRHEVVIEGLPEAFDGYRVVQISDLHCGPFASGRRVAAWVAAVNRLDADLVAVTGDLIASGSTFVPVVARELGGLTARDGVFASMGNHDYFTDGEALAAALERAGLTLLRNRGVQVRRNGAALFVAGVDDTWTQRHDLDLALSERPPATPVLLLAHDPALFPAAAQRGIDLTLSGHTHGGQLGIPPFARKLNLARIMTPFTSGLYHQGGATLYVNHGLGTTGPPVRLGVPPEIAVLTLRSAERAKTDAS